MPIFLLTTNNGGLIGQPYDWSMDQVQQIASDYLKKLPLGVVMLIPFVVGILLGGLLVPAKEVMIEKPVVKESIREVESPIVKVESRCVDVSGAVHSPGVYCSSSGFLLNNYIALADGIDQLAYGKRYTQQYINLAKELRNGDKVYIPYDRDTQCSLELEEPLFSAGKGGDSVLGVSDEGTMDDSVEVVDCIDLNSASKEELVSLSGIGNSTADKIIDARPFEVIEDLLDISGIGESKFAGVKDFVCVL